MNRPSSILFSSEFHVGYRYAFNGQECDNELWGGALAFKYRLENARLGRFFSLDPLFNALSFQSPYAFAENMVISERELEGLETPRRA
jgi:RHS repeat-associated protein